MDLSLRAFGILFTQLIVSLLIFSAGARAQDVSGLRAEYYVYPPSLGEVPNRAKVFLPENLRLARVVPAVNYHSLGIAPPAEGLTPEHYAIRWSGQLLAPETGEYVFHMAGDAGQSAYYDLR